jgi:hypothetical protein
MLLSHVKIIVSHVFSIAQVVSVWFQVLVFQVLSTYQLTYIVIVHVSIKISGKVSSFVHDIVSPVSSFVVVVIVAQEFISLSPHVVSANVKIDVREDRMITKDNNKNFFCIFFGESNK